MNKIKLNYVATKKDVGRDNKQSGKGGTYR